MASTELRLLGTGVMASALDGPAWSFSSIRNGMQKNENSLSSTCKEVSSLALTWVIRRVESAASQTALSS